MSTDNFGEKAQGKEHIKNAVGGMILLIGAYMILNTLNPNLVDFNFKISGVSVSAASIIDASTPPAKNADGTYSEGMCPAGSKVGDTWPSDVPALRTNIESASPSGLGIDVTSSKGTGPEGYCIKNGDPGCTSVYFDAGVSANVLSKISQLKTSCVGCTLMVTGGSECWLHSTHGPNGMAVDFNANASINKFLSGSETFPSDCSWRNLPAVFGSGQALAESSACSKIKAGWSPATHWHIDFARPFK